MKIDKVIQNLRNDAGLSQEQFASLFGVTQQSVQKWENGDSVPELTKIIRISKHFGISLDALIMGNDARIVEETSHAAQITPHYASINDMEFYSSNLIGEYEQCVDEGLDIEAYRDVFFSVCRLPKDEKRKKLGDVLFEIVADAKQKEGYPYTEPSDLEGIQALRKPCSYQKIPGPDRESRVKGAWMGRICGCMLGKSLEGIRTNELTPFLKETDNYPLHRYVRYSDLNEEILNKYNFPFLQRYYADQINGMISDDDTNYTVLSQQIIAQYGRDFTPLDVSNAWLKYLTKGSCWTAERVAYCNFVNGYRPPNSAIYKNPFREFIGAQIRGDYFGYINPGDPALAAEMAWRDASVSHTKNGIYGEMFVAAMLAVAAQTNGIRDILLGGLAQIPHTSRLYAQVMSVLEGFEQGVSEAECFRAIHEKFDEHSGYCWCHTISNAMVVAAALLYGKGDYARSICIAVENGFDTDCNGATVGSVLGMANGFETIPEYWTKPMGDTLETTLFGIERVKISDAVAMTLAHIQK